MLHVVEGTEKSKTTLLKMQFLNCGKDARQHLISFLQTSYASIMVTQGYLAVLLDRERRDTQRVILEESLTEIQDLAGSIGSFEEILSESLGDFPPPKDAS